MAVLQPGQKFGPYRLGERISRGGMGEVWRALKSGAGSWQKTVALKLILPTLDEERFAAMFMAEARIAAALDHANIVPVFGFGQEGGLLYIEMEHVAGRDLRHILARAGAPFPVPLALFVVGEALKGLSYAHERGVVHRDVKPHNALVSYEGSVKLSDFGIAKVAAETGGGISRSEVKGTAGYIAPEVLEGAPASVRSDLFAIGLVLWECLTGKKLFDGASEAERLRRTFECRVPPLRDAGVKAPLEVEELIVRLLAREPTARYASAREALGALLAAPGGREATSVELKLYMGGLFATEAAAAAAASSSGARQESSRQEEKDPSGDGVPRLIDDDGPHVRSAPGRTPTLAGEAGARGAGAGAGGAGGGAGVLGVGGALGAGAEGASGVGTEGRGGPAGASGARGRSRRSWIVGGLAVAAAASVAAAVLWQPGGGGPGRNGATAVGARAADAGVVAPEPAQAPSESSEAVADVVIEVVPSDARVTVDGKLLLGGSPFALAGVAHGRTLAVRVERDGFAPFAGTLSIDAPLVRLPVVLVALAADSRAPRDPTPRSRGRKVAKAPGEPAAPAAPAPSPAPDAGEAKRRESKNGTPTPRPKTPSDDDATMTPVEPEP